jgi:hypothetical protein
MCLCLMGKYVSLLGVQIFVYVGRANVCLCRVGKFVSMFGWWAEMCFFGEGGQIVSMLGGQKCVYVGKEGKYVSMLGWQVFVYVGWAKVRLCQVGKFVSMLGCWVNMCLLREGG